ncbi:MAG TPA: hypothetical protein PLJ44_09685 [Victivallales bacterium]|nr:hypothetical protein [Victivallales bacterium]
MEGYTYFAFISYSRKDERWAKWLQRKLENYRLPSTVSRQKPDLPKKIKIFRDKTDLTAGCLRQELKKELKSSKTVKEESSEKKSNPPLKELSDKVVILITEAKNAEKNSNYDVAIWHYQKIFEYDKENQSALVGLAGIFYAKNEKDKAMSYIKLLNPEKIYDPYDALKAAKISLAIFPQDKNNALLFYKKAIELGAEKDKEFENLLK